MAADRPISIIEGELKSDIRCRNTFGVTYNTAYRDLSDLVERGLLVQRGKGRATRYEINTD